MVTSVSLTISNSYKSGRQQSKLKRHHKGSSIRKVRFNSVGHLVTIAKTVKIHDLTSNSTLHTLKRDDGKPIQLYSVKPFGQNIVSAGDDDGALFAWDTRTPDKPIFSSYDCEQYISDIDGKYEARKLIVCTSGEGTLTAYDMRAMKMIEPQSELFETGFQCLKMVELNKKVVIGGEDGALYVFNHNEWAHTSGKFAISTDAQNRGKCSIDCIDVLPDETTFFVGCSDGKIRASTLWPHRTISEAVFCRKSPLESIHINQIEGRPEFVVCGENNIEIVHYEEKEDQDSSGSDTDSLNDQQETSTADGSAQKKTKAPSEDQRAAESEIDGEKSKKLKPDTEDYLNLFH